MKIKKIIQLFILSTIILFSSLNPAYSHPLKPWLGKWVGECRALQASNILYTFNMSLTISPLDQANEFSWKLFYEANGNIPSQVKEYSLRAVDILRNHYITDEQNGLLLDTFINGNVTYSTFTISGVLITGTYTLLDENSMMIHLPSFKEGPIRQTCVDGAPNLCVDSFGLMMSQHCLLKFEDHTEQPQQ